MKSNINKLLNNLLFKRKKNEIKSIEDDDVTLVLKKRVAFSDLNVPGIEIPDSDIVYNDDKYLYFFNYSSNFSFKKQEITPGAFVISSSNRAITLKNIEFKPRGLLESISNTSAILNEARTFFSRLYVYEKLNRLKKRGVLLYSSPGMGKTAAIEKVCLDLIKEDPGTVILVWPTSQVYADTVLDFLSTGVKYNSSCTRMILVIEDIGGSENIGTIDSDVDSGLLNLLDGIGNVFKIPTFIIATTNYPEKLLSCLADRPGRFDLVLNLTPPSYEEKVELMEFFAKRSLTEEEKSILKSKDVKNFSIAHLEEAVVRAELHNKTIIEVINELIKHKKLFENDFQENKKNVGFD